MTATDFLSDVEDRFAFRLADGRCLMNLEDLLFLLESEGSRWFAMHVTDAKNDFASWIGDVIKDEELAARLRETKSLDRTIMVLSMRIGHLREQAMPEAGSPAAADEPSPIAPAEKDDRQAVLDAGSDIPAEEEEEELLPDYIREMQEINIHVKELLDSEVKRNIKEREMAAGNSLPMLWLQGLKAAAGVRRGRGKN